MPNVNVWVAPEDILEDLSTRQLEEELSRRHRAGGPAKSADSDLWTRVGMAEDLRTAFYARDASRFETLRTALDSGGPTHGLTKAPIAAFAAGFGKPPVAGAN